MRGRLINDAPACNEHGVPFKTLLLRERESSLRLLALYREALECWLEADDQPPNARKRWDLVKKARLLTERALQ